MKLNAVSLIVGTAACLLGIIHIFIGDLDWTIILFIGGFSNLILSKIGEMEEQLQERMK